MINVLGPLASSTAIAVLWIHALRSNYFKELAMVLACLRLILLAVSRFVAFTERSTAPVVWFMDLAQLKCALTRPDAEEDGFFSFPAGCGA